MQDGLVVRFYLCNKDYIMKRSGKNLKITFSVESRNQFKLDTKIPSTQRSVDTNFLFKNDQMKELSKFALNPASRDVSHIRDRLSVSLPKLVPSLPTNFDHLKQLYYSSDPLGMPYSISSSNLVSSLSCKKQSCIEKVLHTHNSLLQEDFSAQPIERLNLGNPTGRQDIKSLQNWLREMKENNLETLQKDPLTWDLNTIENAEILYVIAGKELIRQVGVQCIERGEVLKEILWFFTTVFKAQKNQYVKDLREKVDKITKEIDEKIYKHARQIAQYEIVVQKKCEKISELKVENENLSQMLQKTQISLIKIQSSQELKGGIFSVKMSPVMQIPEKNEAQKRNEKKNVEKGENEEAHDRLKADVVRNKEKKGTWDESKVLTVNEILHGDLNENEKNLQTESESKIFDEVCTQTEKLVKKGKNKFEFRPRIIESKQKPDLHIEEQENLTLFPQLKLSSDISGKTSPEPLQFSPKLDSIFMIKAQKTLKTMEDELQKLEISQKSLKRASLLPTSTTTKSKSRLSPIPSENQKKPRKMSQQIQSAEYTENDILLNNVLIKQKAYNDLAETIKSKKQELQNLTSEIEDKQKKLNKMKIELQMKYLEAQTTNSPVGVNNKTLQKILVDKLERLNEENTEGFDKDELGIGDLSQVISQNFHLVSWKAGFSAGFEKGVAVGFSQGEELGIEVGEDKGFIKTIKEYRGENDSKSESSSLDSEKDDEHGEDELVQNKKNEEENRNFRIKAILDKKVNDEFRRSSEENKEKIKAKSKLVSQASFASINSAHTFEKSESLGSMMDENLKQFRTFDSNYALKRSITMADYNKQLKTSEKKSNRMNLEPVITEEKIHIKRSSSVSSSSKTPTKQLPAPKSTKNLKNSRKITEKFTFKGQPAQRGLLPELKDLKSPRKPDPPEPNLLQKSDPNCKPDPNSSKLLQKQHTFKDPTNKEQITITINEEKPEKQLNQIEELSIEPSRLIIRPNRQRKNSSSSKYSKSEFEDMDRVGTSGNEEVSDVEGKKRKESNGITRKRFREITKFNEFHFHSRVHQLVRKANPATKIIENFLQKSTEKIIKRSKMSKRMAYRILNSIYQSFYNKGKTTDTLLVEHAYEEFLQKYSVKSVSSKKLKEFLAALLKTSSCRRSLMFLRLTNISEKIGVKGYSQNSVALYMQALNFMLNSKLGIIIAVDETADKILIPVVRATECVKEIFENKFDKNIINRILIKLEMISIKDPKKINSAGLIECELALEQILEIYEEMQKSFNFDQLDQFRSRDRGDI